MTPFYLGIFAASLAGAFIGGFLGIWSGLRVAAATVKAYIAAPEESIHGD